MKTLTVRFNCLLLSIVAITGLLAIFVPATASAQASASNGHCNTFFLTIPAWYNNINRYSGGECEIASPTEVGGLSVFIWQIALNVIEMMLHIAGYVAVAFIIVGGYRYMISAGSPDGMIAARKTIMNAVIGLVISIVSVGLVRTVATYLGGGNG